MIKETLQKLPNLVKIEECKDPGIFKERYFLYFSQPLNHNNKRGKKFIQKVEFGFNGIDAINIFYTSGYNLDDSIYLKDKKPNSLELVKHFKANWINPDYRFYGDSIPQSADFSRPSSYEHLTIQQAAEDFHNLYKSFKTIFKNKYIQTGGSKGGLTSNFQAALHPSDADLYVSYVSTRLTDRTDDDFIKNIYTKIGKDSKLNLDLYRKEITIFQKHLLEHSYNLSPVLQSKYLYNDKYKYVDFAKENFNLLYNACVTVFPIGFWQFSPKEAYKEIHLINHIKNYEEKCKAIEKYWIDACGLNTWSLTDPSMSFSYFLQCYRQMGTYSISVEYLTKNLLKYCKDKYKNLGDVYKELGNDRLTYEALNQDLWYLLTIPKEFLEYYKQYDKSLQPVLDNFYQNTKAKVILIYGSDDTWYNSRMNNKKTLKKSKNITEIVAKGKSHTIKISTLPKVQQTKVWKLIDKIIKEK